MKIIIETHTLARAKERGANKNEILDVIKTGKETSAKYGKLAKYKIYEFDKNWFANIISKKWSKCFILIKKIL